MVARCHSSGLCLCAPAFLPPVCLGGCFMHLLICGDPMPGCALGGAFSSLCLLTVAPGSHHPACVCCYRPALPFHPQEGSLSYATAVGSGGLANGIQVSGTWRIWHFPGRWGQVGTVPIRRCWGVGYLSVAGITWPWCACTSLQKYHVRSLMKTCVKRHVGMVCKKGRVCVCVSVCLLALRHNFLVVKGRSVKGSMP